MTTGEPPVMSRGLSLCARGSALAGGNAVNLICKPVDTFRPRFPRFSARFGAGAGFAPLNTPPESAQKVRAQPKRQTQGDPMRTRQRIGSMALRLAAALVLVVALAGASRAGPIIDQQYGPPPGNANASIQLSSPIGQSFTP